LNRATETAWLAERYEFHPLDLEEVVPRSQGPQLVVAPFLRTLAHLAGIGARETPCLLAAHQVLVGPEFPLHSP